MSRFGAQRTATPHLLRSAVFLSAIQRIHRDRARNRPIFKTALPFGHNAFSILVSLFSQRSMANGTSHSPRVGLKAAALFEALKGLLVILAGLGLLAFVHRDAQAFAERLVLHLHLNPARHYPRIFIEAAGRLTDARIWLF